MGQHLSASLIGLRYDCARLNLDVRDLNDQPARIQRRLMRHAIKVEQKRRAKEKAV